MEEIELLIFDLDGTLVDSKLDLLNALNYTAATLNYPSVPEDAFPAMVGNGVRVLISKAFSLELESDLLEKALAVFQDFYKEHLTDKTRFFPGVLDTIQHFSHKKLAVLSNKPDEFTKPIINELGLSKNFSYVLGATQELARKPSGEAILHIMQALGVSASNTMMVGDGDADILAGKDAGVKTCAVTYGFRSRQELEALKPDFIIDSMVSLQNL